MLSFFCFLQLNMKDMSIEEFKRHKEALAVRRLEKPKQLSHRAVRYWSEITSGDYFFDRDAVEVAELQGISHQDLVAFFREYVFHDASQRRKIAVHVLSNVPQDKAEPIPNGQLSASPFSKAAQVVEDVAIFKRSLPLFPLIKSSTMSAASKL